MCDHLFLGLSTSIMCIDCNFTLFPVYLQAKLIKTLDTFFGVCIKYVDAHAMQWSAEVFGSGKKAAINGPKGT